MGEFRSHVMKKIQSVVEAHYEFQNTKDICQIIENLLVDDSFACKD